VGVIKQTKEVCLREPILILQCFKHPVKEHVSCFLVNFTAEIIANKDDTEMFYMYKLYDIICGLVVKVPGYITEMYYASCEVRTEIIYVM
jgi:hypothetical protein